MPEVMRLQLDARLSSTRSFFSTTTFYTSPQLRHSFGAEYSKKTIGWMKRFNMRWTLSFLSVFRNAGIASNIFRNFSRILGCNPIAKRVLIRTGNECNIDGLFLLQHKSFAV